MTRRSPSGRYYQWTALIEEARKVPGVWQTLLPDAPITVVPTVRYQRHPDLRQPDGQLEARARHEYTDNRGKRRANIDLRWVPTYDRQVTNPEEDTHVRE